MSPLMTGKWLNAKQITRLLRQTIDAAGGAAVWCRQVGQEKARSNVANMVVGKIKVTTSLSETLGYRKVMLELYVPKDEPLPEALERFVFEAAPGAGAADRPRPAKKKKEPSLLGRARYQDLDLTDPYNRTVYTKRVAEEFEGLSFAALCRRACAAMGREPGTVPFANRHVAILAIADARMKKLAAKEPKA